MSSDTPFIKRNRPVTQLIETSYTRPADTTTYAAGDVVANSTSSAQVLTFQNIARAAGLGGVIQAAYLVDSAAQTLRPDFELFLFDVAPTMQQDNVAWAPTDSEMEKCQGVIRFPPGLFNVGNGNGIVDVGSLGKSFRCGSTVRDLYGVLVTRNAYVPISAEKFTVRLLVIQD